MSMLPKVRDHPNVHVEQTGVAGGVGCTLADVVPAVAVVGDAHILGHVLPVTQRQRSVQPNARSQLI